MHSHYINGQWVAGEGPVFVTTNPADGSEIWSGHAAAAADIDAACQAARASFGAWAAATLDERIAICARFRDLLNAHGEALARMISIEVGKPLWEARTEVTSMANKIDISVQSYRARTGETTAKIADGDAVLRHRPHGVFGVFGPYNFPGHLPNGHIVPALIAGNTLVFKPSEYAPQTAIKTVELWAKAGLPKGVLNLVNGARDTGAALAQHPALDGILFTGSYQTGAILHRQFAGQPGKMLALEMGGNNALVAWDIGNLDAVVDGLVHPVAPAEAGGLFDRGRRAEGPGIHRSAGGRRRKNQCRRLRPVARAIHGASGVRLDCTTPGAGAIRFDRTRRQGIVDDAPPRGKHRLSVRRHRRCDRRQGYPG